MSDATVETTDNLCFSSDRPRCETRSQCRTSTLWCSLSQWERSSLLRICRQRLPTAILNVSNRTALQFFFNFVDRIKNGQKEVGLQTVWIWNEIWNLEAQPFEMQISGHHCAQHHLKSWHQCPDLKWFGFGTKVISWPFENQTIWILIFNKSRFQRFSDFEWLDFRSPL